MDEGDKGYNHSNFFIPPIMPPSPSCTLLVPLFPFLSTQLDAHANLVNRSRIERLRSRGKETRPTSPDITYIIYRTIYIRYNSLSHDRSESQEKKTRMILHDHIYTTYNHIVSGQYDYTLQFSSMKLRILSCLRGKHVHRLWVFGSNSNLQVFNLAYSLVCHLGNLPAFGIQGTTFCEESARKLRYPYWPGQIYGFNLLIHIESNERYLCPSSYQ